MSNCTIYQNIFKFKEPHKISIKKALQRIKNGSSKLIVENLRKETDAFNIFILNLTEKQKKSEINSFNWIWDLRFEIWDSSLKFL